MNYLQHAFKLENITNHLLHCIKIAKTQSDLIYHKLVGAENDTDTEKIVAFNESGIPAEILTDYLFQIEKLIYELDKYTSENFDILKQVQNEHKEKENIQMFADLAPDDKNRVSMIVKAIHKKRGAEHEQNH